MDDWYSLTGAGDGACPTGGCAGGFGAAGAGDGAGLGIAGTGGGVVNLGFGISAGGGAVGPELVEGVGGLGAGIGAGTGLGAGGGVGFFLVSSLTNSSILAIFGALSSGIF